jgi:hypothetical protein
VDRKSLRAVKKRAIIAEFVQWFNEHDPTDWKIVLLSLRIPAEAFGFLKGGAGSGAGLFQQHDFEIP